MSYDNLDSNEEKSARRERFNRRKGWSRSEEKSDQKRREHYKRNRINYDNMIDEDYEELWDQEWPE